ncbi:MAG: hypothetical protein ABIY35_05470 [Chitinophagaceae bacterium]
MPYTNKLPAFVLAGLFKNNLISPDRDSNNNAQFTEKKSILEIKNPEKKAMAFLGKNLKNILIIVKEKNAEIIAEDRKNILLKILTACKLTPDDVAILNFGKKMRKFEEIKPTFLPEKVLLFDVTTKELGLPFIIPYYQVQQFDGCIYVCAPAIVLDNEERDENIKAEKKKLWTSLKKIFLDT